MSAIEKFMAERIIQRCDYEESISKKHRTINGYTQLKELIKLCELSFKRSKTNKTLQIILKEAKSKNIKQNIKNDHVIQYFFSDFNQYITDYDENKVNTNSQSNDISEIHILLHNLKIYEVQLEKYYFDMLKRELLKINYQEKEKITRECDSVSELIDLLIPYLLYKGYSISSINEVIRRWIEKRYKITIDRILKFFSMKDENYDFLVRIGQKNQETKDFIALIEKASVDGIKLLKGNDVTEKFQQKNNIKSRELLIRYTANTHDPNAHIRSQYDSLLKKLVISKDRKSLLPFVHYFENCYWMSNTHKNKMFNKVIISGDPISVPARKSTLRESLISLPDVDFKKQSEFIIPENQVLHKGIYYYNLALGSKSMENSLSLLWTSLETILPYRIHNSDIECIKHILGKSLSIGSIARDFYSLANRISALNKQNSGYLNKIGVNKLGNYNKIEGIKKWYQWFSDISDIKNRFQILKDCSELLAYEYLKFVKPFSEGKLEDLLIRIQSSRESIEYQLQRIYLHRNQIVHSGDLINEYSNLWLHLEWYVGKVLFYSLYKLEYQKEESNTLDSIFRELESEYDYLTSYIEKKPKKKCTDSKRIIDSLLELYWQAI